MVTGAPGPGPPRQCPSIVTAHPAATHVRMTRYAPCLDGRGPMPRRQPHRDVADRFRYFLHAAELTREAFIDRIDGAITAASLFSILNGSRRPSRPLAALIERTWGFRADFLLHGDGGMWLASGPAAPEATSAPLPRAEALSPREQEVIAFMRASVENARALESELTRARVWARLFGRTIDLLRQLDACGMSRSESDVRIYPLFVKLVYDECRTMAHEYEQLVSLLQERRVHKLVDGFLHHFVERVPREILTGEERNRLQAMLAPVVKHRRQRLQALERSLTAVNETIDNLCRLGSFEDLIERESSAAGRRRRLSGRLLEKVAAPDRDEVRKILSELEPETDSQVAYWARLQRLVRDLMGDITTETRTVEAQTTEQLRAKRLAAVDPLTP